MGRRSNLNEPAVFSAVANSLNVAGTVTLAGVVTTTGISMGSLYHRYGSREGLLAAAWMDALQGFANWMVPLLADTSPAAGAKAAMATPRFCRAEPDRAIILACCRQSEFITSATNPAVLEQIDALNLRVQSALQTFAKQQALSMEVARLSLVSFPLGAVRQFLPGQTIPLSIDTYVAAAFEATVAAFIQSRESVQESP